MAYFLNGDIYVKLAPDYKTRYKKSNNLTILNRQTGQELDLNNPEELKLISSSSLSYFEKNGAIQKELITTDNVGIYQIFFLDEKIYMMDRSENRMIEYHSVDEIELEYMNVSEFLSKAIYVGRKLKSKTLANKGCELLYEFDNVCLLKDGDNYFALSKNRTLTDYEIGEILPQYYDKKSIYEAIIDSKIKQHRER